ncbi:hypothetical protein Lal_00017154 [Lupinus albus]|nr:hypothetical protein Lal_00017154 [Lupinus albus]
MACMENSHVNIGFGLGYVHGLYASYSRGLGLRWTCMACMLDVYVADLALACLVHGLAELHGLAMHSNLLTNFSLFWLNKHITLTSRPRSFWKSLWKYKTHSKVLSFVWRLFQDRIPTKDALSRRGVLSHSNGGILYPFCNDHLESSSHIFSSCSLKGHRWTHDKGKGQTSTRGTRTTHGRHQRECSTIKVALTCGDHSINFIHIIKSWREDVLIAPDWELKHGVFPCVRALSSPNFLAEPRLKVLIKNQVLVANITRLINTQVLWRLPPHILPIFFYLTTSFRCQNSSTK